MSLYSLERGEHEQAFRQETHNSNKIEGKILAEEGVFKLLEGDLRVSFDINEESLQKMNVSQTKNTEKNCMEGLLRS